MGLAPTEMLPRAGKGALYTIYVLDLISFSLSAHTPKTFNTFPAQLIPIV